MFLFPARLPITEDDRQWVDTGFERLSRLVGHSRMLHAEVVLPTDQYFPDSFDSAEKMLQTMFERVCSYMRVDRRHIEVELFPDETAELRKLLPHWSGGSNGCAGLYTRDEEGEQRVIALKESQLQDPFTLVATIAHELGHEILLGGKLLDRNVSDMEPLTDLLTVFLGFGVFNANASASFQQFQDSHHQGWSAQRLGYLPQPMFGYALARFAAERGEKNPAWAKHLTSNVRADFRNSAKWLLQNRPAMVAAASR